MLRNYLLALFLIAQSLPTSHADLLYRGKLNYSDSTQLGDRYPEEVAIFRSSMLAEQEPYDLVLHLHGYLSFREDLDGRLENIDDVLSEFDFDSLLSASRRPAVLVVPSSLGNCDTYLSYLNNEVRIRLFLASVIEKIGRAPRRLILIGHSGAYHSLARISETSLPYPISELYLLDASYGEEKSFSRYAKNPAHRFVTIFRTGTDTETGSYKIWRLLFPRISRSRAYAKFRRSLLPANSSVQEIPRSGPHFIATDGDHWRLVSEYWPTLIGR